jgi:hypothetical protein
MEHDLTGLVAQLSGLPGLLLLLSGCMLMHLRLRRRSTLSLLLSLAAIAAWMLVGQALLHDVLLPADGAPDMVVLARLGVAQSVALAVDGALLLWLGLSFFLAVKSIRLPSR